jgi:hypothetical protein
MSLWARITIGVVSAFAAVCFVLIGLFLGPELPNGPWPFYGLAAFWGIVAVACLVPRSKPLAVRLIGAAVCGAFAVYAGSSFGTDNFLPALAGFAVLGVPGAYVAISGRYPSWGRAAAAFNNSASGREKVGP